MARATRRKNKVQNSQNESVEAAEETESTTASDRPKRNAKLNNKSWQDLIPKSRKSAGSTNKVEKEVGVEEDECDENKEEDLADRTKKNITRTARLNNKSCQDLISKSRNSVGRGGKEEKDVDKEKVEDDPNEEDMADRIKKNRRSAVKDISSTNVKGDKRNNKNKKVAKKTEPKLVSLSIQDNASDVEDSFELKDKDLSKPDEVTEVIKPSSKPSRKRGSKESIEAAADQVAEVIKPSRKKASKNSGEAAVNEIVDDVKRSKRGPQKKSEKAPKIVNNSIIENIEGEDKKRNSKVRETRSANNSNMDDQVRKTRHSKSKLEEDNKTEDNDEIKVSDKNVDDVVVRTSLRRSSSRIETAQLEEINNKAKNNVDENKGEKENEEIFTKVITKNPSVKRSKVLLKPPPKQYNSKPNNKQKLPPKKSLASRDILNLLSDVDDDSDVDELDEAEKQTEKGTALKDKTNTLSARTKSLAQSTIMDAFAKTPPVPATKMNSPRKSLNRIFTSRSLQNSPNPSESLASRKVPVWKKVANDSTSVESKINKPVHDVFNMDCYGEEEFGPEDVKAKKKKRAPRKKGTKGILVFGGNTKKQVKQICNLKTPGDQNKRKKRIINIVDPQNLPPATEINSVTNTENTQVPNTRNMKPPADNPPKPPTDNHDRAARLEVPKPTYQNKNPEASFIRPQTSLLVDNTPIGLPQPRRIEMDSHLSTDFSTGAQAYFDSNAGTDHTNQGDDDHHNDDDYFEGPPPPPEDLPDQPMSNRSGLFGQSVLEPHKSYKTPAVPRHMTKLQTKNASTPRMEDRVQPKEPVTVKEQIKNAFGFDDSTDEDETDGESFAISPVRKVADPVLAMLNSPSNSICGASSRLSTLPGSRLSTFSTSSRLSMVPKGGFLTSSINAGHKIEEKKNGPFRFTMGPSNNALLAARLVAQAKKMPPKFSKPLPKSSSSLKQAKSSSSSHQIYPSSNLKQTKIPESIAQQASNNLKVPAVSYGNKNDEDEDGIEEVNKASDNASDKSAKQKVKKMIKKAPKNKPPDPDQSSVLEEVKPVRSKPLRNAAKEANERLEEISKSPEKEKSPNSDNSPVKRSRPVAKTYVRKNNISRPTVSFDESIPHSPPKKPKIREEKLNQWAALQTSHFSEVDDFDLSFA